VLERYKCVCVYICVCVFFHIYVCVCMFFSPEPSTKRRMSDVSRGAAGTLQALGEGNVQGGAAGTLQALCDGIVRGGAAGVLQALCEGIVRGGAAGALQALGADNGPGEPECNALMRIGAVVLSASRGHPLAKLAFVGICITYVLW